MHFGEVGGRVSGVSGNPLELTTENLYHCAPHMVKCSYAPCWYNRHEHHNSALHIEAGGPLKFLPNLLALEPSHTPHKTPSIPTYVWGLWGCTCSLVPRLSPRMTTMNSREGESLVPFRTWCNGTNIMDISIGKFRCHSHADRPFSSSVYLRVGSLGSLKWKGRPGYAVDDACQFAGTKFCHRRVRNE